MKVVLCIPPDYDHNFPPLGTPALLGFLKAKKVDAAQIDLNLAYRDFLISKIRGKDLKETDKNIILAPLLKLFFSKKLKNRYYSNFLPRLSDKASAYLPYNNNSNSSFYFTERLLASKYLFRYLTDLKENTFYQFYDDHKLIGYLEKENTKVLGISIISPSQAIAAFTLGLLVKKKLPHAHVTIGGQWATLFKDELINRKDLFSCFDSLIVFEGESAFYKLVQALENNILLKGTNIITKDTDIPRLDHKGEKLNSLACPDFSGLLSKKHHGPFGTRALTYETSRGCYWSKCAYCVDLPLPKPLYRAKRADIVARQVKELVKNYGAKRLMMGDPGMAPRQMLEISKAFIKNRIKIKWWTMARLDRGFNKEIFQIAYRAGLYKINFGFESACDKVCDFLHKGNRQEVSARLIKDCATAGIKVDLQTIIGMPGETFADAMDTISFLIENKKYIAAVTFNVFYLTPKNHVYFKPTRYGIVYNKNKVLPFQFFIPFKNKSGISKEQARFLISAYWRLLSSGKKTKRAAANAKNIIKRFGRAAFHLCGERVVLAWKKYASGAIGVSDEQ